MKNVIVIQLGKMYWSHVKDMELLLESLEARTYQQSVTSTIEKNDRYHAFR